MATSPLTHEIPDRSVQRYLMLAQDHIAATIFAREGDDWIGIEVPLAELCTDFDLAEDA